MKFKPLYDKILVESFPKEEKTVGGIFIPETETEKSTKGKVIAVGTGYLNKEGKGLLELSVKEGDTVVFNQYSGTEIKIDDKKYLIMAEENILGILNNN